MPSNCGKSLTLCWYCKNSYTNGCSWAAELVPVNGWSAEPCTLGGGIESFNVTDCPSFVRDASAKDKRIGKLKPIKDNEAAMELAGQIVKQACVDFVAAYKFLHDPKQNEKLKASYEIYKKGILRKAARGKKTDKSLTFEEFSANQIRDKQRTVQECEFFFRSHYFGIISNMDGPRLLQRLKQRVMTKVVK